MVVVMIIFALSGAAIASGVVYAAIQLVKSDRTLKRSQHKRDQQKKKTLIDISTTCKKIEDADDDTTKDKLLIELGSIRRWIEKYY